MSFILVLKNNKLHYKRHILGKIAIIFLLFLPFASLAQWTDTFDGNLENWSGEVQKFRINESNMLQLNDSDAGDSFIYRGVNIDADTISITLNHLMDFSPSANNQSTIYLFVDNVDIELASGYAIRIGENGSDDALNFIFLDSGQEEVIASGTMGALGTDPAQLLLEIDIYPDGLWEVRTDYSGGSTPISELQFVEDRYDVRQESFFGIYAAYSSSRADLFFYDDISIDKFEPDTEAPVVVDVAPILPNMISVSFSEFINETGLVLNNYSLDNSIGSPSTVLNTGDDLTFILTFDQDFDLQIAYTLTINGVEDLFGNPIQNTNQSFILAKVPESGDLLLSEILFDPYTGGEDFIEIYNNSNFFLDLHGLEIVNFDREESNVITNEIILAPYAYLALGENTNFLIQEYKPEDVNTILENELPAFNNDSGNVSIVSQNGTVLDSFFYSEDLHFSLIDDTEGVSLERVSFDIDASDQNNWRSAAENVRFATPGYLNSNLVTTNITDEFFNLQSEIFSPNQDGDNDVMILNYNLDKPGYVANIKIYDAAGYEVNQIANNQLLGSNGFLLWEGLNQEGQIANLGIYIIAGEIFHPDGEVYNVKIVTVLADFID